MSDQREGRSEWGIRRRLRRFLRRSDRPPPAGPARAGQRAEAEPGRVRFRKEDPSARYDTILRLVLDNIPQRIFWKDRDSVYWGCNKAFAQDAGVETPEDIRGKTDYELVWTKAEAERFRAGDHRVMEADKPEYHSTESVLRPGGKLAWLDTTRVPLHDPSGSVVGVLGACQDVTERKQTEDALREERNFVSAVLDTVGALVVVLDAQGRIVRWNRACEEATGYSFEKVRGTRIWRSLLLNEERAAVEALTDRVLGGEFPVRHDHHWIARDGLRLFIAWTNTVVRNGAGAIEYLVASGIDVTERRRVARALADRLRYEKAIAACSQELLVGTDTHAAIGRALGQLLIASGVSRVYIFENLADPHDGLCMRQTHEVCAPCLGSGARGPGLGSRVPSPQPRVPSPDSRAPSPESRVPSPDSRAPSPEPRLRQRSYKDGFARWAEVLAAGKPIKGAVDTFPAEERALLKSQDILSVLVLPLWAGGEWFGFVGFDDTRERRAWHDSDVQLLQTGAGMIGAYIERQRAEEAVRKAQIETEQLLTSISSILIGAEEHDRVIRWNPAAEATFGMASQDVVRRLLSECGLPWDGPRVTAGIARCRAQGQPVRLDDLRFTRRDGKPGFLTLTINPVVGEQGGLTRVLIVGADVTERKVLESQLAQAQKLESIGQLAAGIAHEINTPTQFVGDNTRFLQEAFADLQALLRKFTELLEAGRAARVTPQLVADVETAIRAAELDYLATEIPKAIEQSLEGVQRVAKIVRAMKEFSHPDSGERQLIDLNKAIESTVTVARNEWKYVAEVVTDFDSELPPVPVFPGDFNQVILNILVNAAHAIADVVGDSSNGKGQITIHTRRAGDRVEIRIADTGTGIPEQIRARVFDPFFTTKDVGKGTGQGLAIAHAVVAEKHGGTITFETEVGRGTTFIICLPLEPARADKGECDEQAAGSARG